MQAHLNSGIFWPSQWQRGLPCGSCICSHLHGLLRQSYPRRTSHKITRTLAEGVLLCTRIVYQNRTLASVGQTPVYYITERAHKHRDTVTVTVTLHGKHGAPSRYTLQKCIYQILIKAELIEARNLQAANATSQLVSLPYCAS